MDSNHNLTPNVPTLFTAPVNRRDMSLGDGTATPSAEWFELYAT
jgi:hypothetical protein